MLTPESLYLGQYCWNVTWSVVYYGMDVSTDRELRRVPKVEPVTDVESDVYSREHKSVTRSFQSHK